ncbi:hypothetical protein GCM10011607_11550 [Shewanella inventionis]|uniref:DUF3630 family protein n=1 Tax=Shewanella inventionis TaxID=1738770 RepID=A0ABQ1IUC3_9GAMM|nr:hypothetical protein [Shewanella inventionis]GGB52726.1 hypothetical protein GCM10011607_11550 [Shewanella inventionis]
MENLLKLLASYGANLDDDFNGVYVIEGNGCRLALDNWYEDEQHVFSIEYIDPVLEETIFEVTLTEGGEFLNAFYNGESIDEDDLENELEERFS